MSLINRRGMYFDPMHNRKEDWDFLREWQPSVVRLKLEGKYDNPDSVSVNYIERVHQTAPNAQIILRNWEVDDDNYHRHEEMAANPEATADKLLDWWHSIINRTNVPRELLVAGLWNEVHPSKYAPLWVATRHALRRAIKLNVRIGVGIFSTGNPALPGDAEYDINRFAELDPLVIESNGLWLLHEYMQPEGMYGEWIDEKGDLRKDYSYLIGRHKRWPIKGNIVIAEWGIEGILYDRHRDPVYGNAGWLNFKELWPPTRYADEYVACVRDAAANVLAHCPFISDWAAHRWQSADLLPAYGEFLKRKHLCEVEGSQPTAAPVETRLPLVGGGVSQDNWKRSREFVKRWEGGFTANPEDHGNWTGGKKGQGELKGTNFGISAASYPHLDIRNLTIEQADNIYFRDYWQASGADKLPYPYCLLVFDTAVLHGVGTARKWVDEVGDNAYAFAAKRLKVYTKLDNWHFFGAGWVNRTAELLEVAGS